MKQKLFLKNWQIRYLLFALFLSITYNSFGQYDVDPSYPTFLVEDTDEFMEGTLYCNDDQDLVVVYVRKNENIYSSGDIEWNFKCEATMYLQYYSGGSWYTVGSEFFDACNVHNRFFTVPYSSLPNADKAYRIKYVRYASSPNCYGTPCTDITYYFQFFAITQEEVPCDVPGSPHVENITSTSARLDWSSVSVVDYYEVRYREEGYSWDYENTSSSYLDISGLDCLTDYEYQVKTHCDGGGSSDWSSTVEFSTIGETCNYPSGLEAENITATTARLDWNTVSGVDYYYVRYKKSGYSWQYETTYSSFLDISGLDCNSNYEFQVMTYCDCGTSSWSGTEYFSTTCCVSAPTVTTNSATSITETSAVLNGAVNPNCVSTQYRFEYGLTASYGNTTSWSSIGSGTTAQTVNEAISGLTPNTTYHFRVCATNSEGTNCGNDMTFTTNSPSCIVTEPEYSTGEPWLATCFLMSNGIIDERPEVQPDNLIIRQDVAKILYLSLYLSLYGEIESPAYNFPTLFQDLLQIGNDYHKYAISLSYLEFGDGKAPFDRQFINFNPGDTIKRKYYVKALLEAFNIPLDETGTSPYLDVDETDDMFPYILKAYNTEILDNDLNYFRPDEGITRIEAFLMLYRVLNSNPELTMPTQAELEDTTNYFVPINLTQLNYGMDKGLYEGVFKTYSKNAFSLNDIGFDLSFGIFYNSYIFEQPRELYLINSLPSGWSHSFDLKIIEAQNAGYNGIPYDEGVIINENSFACLVYPDGSANIFDRNNNYEPITKGIYSTLDKISDTQYTLTTIHKTVFTFTYKTDNDFGDPVYMLTSIKDRNDNELVITYKVDAPYLIDQVTAQSGRTLTFSYNADNQISQVTDNSLSRSINITYDNGKLSSFTDANGKTTNYAYDNSGEPHTEYLLNQITLPRGNTITVEYDERKAKAIETSDGIRIDVSPQVLDNQTVYSVSTGGNLTEYTINYVPRDNAGSGVVDGMIDNITATNGLDIDFTFDANGDNPTLPTDISTNGIEVEYTYNALTGNILSRSIVGTTISESFTYHPEFNLLTSYTDPNSNTIEITRNNTNGNAEAIEDALDNVTNIDYNSWGLPTSITNPEGITVNYVYNSYGNVEEVNAPLGISTQITYDDASRPTSVTINGNTTEYEYDLVDNLLIKRDALNHETEYVYDDNYNISQIINAKGDATTMTYDNNDLLASVSFGGFTERYSYYEDGALDTITKPSGQFLKNVYDTKGRLKSNEYITDISYYETGIHTNLMQSISNANGTLTYSYDNVNRLSSYTDYFGNTVTYNYDDASNITSVVYPDGKSVSYTYDANNNLKTVTADWLSKTIVTYNYRADGLLSEEILGNGMTISYTYDGAGRLIDKTINYSAGTELQSWDYVWDLSGNIISETQSQNLFGSYPSDPTPELEYAYNNVNRITSISGDENITFSFDDDGNTTSKTGTTYSWDINDMLTGVSGNFNATYEYDALGMRRKAIRNGTENRYVLDVQGMEDVLMVTDENNAPIWHYIQGIGIVARVYPGGEISYYLHDYRGSTIAMVDDLELTTHKYSYDEFGTVLQIQENDPNEFRYVGKFGVFYEDEDLQFMRHRYTDNTTGRFLSEDPVWSTNLYPYADNNSIINVDYNGKEAMNLAGWVDFSYNEYEAIEIDWSNFEQEEEVTIIIKEFPGYHPNYSENDLYTEKNNNNSYYRPIFEEAPVNEISEIDIACSIEKEDFLNSYLYKEEIMDINKYLWIIDTQCDDYNFSREEQRREVIELEKRGLEPDYYFKH